MNNYDECGKCGSNSHSTQWHNAMELSASEFYKNHYDNKVCYTITDWFEFAEAYVKVKRDGLPDVPKFVSHKTL